MKKVLLLSALCASSIFAMGPTISEIHLDNFDSQVFTLGITGQKTEISDINGKVIGVHIGNKATLYNKYGGHEFYWRGKGRYDYASKAGATMFGFELGFGDTIKFTERSYLNFDLGLLYASSTGDNDSSNIKDKTEYGAELSATLGFPLSSSWDVGVRGLVGFKKIDAELVSGPNKVFKFKKKYDVMTTEIGVPLRWKISHGVSLDIYGGYQMEEPTKHNPLNLKDSQAIGRLSLSWKYAL